MAENWEFAMNAVLDKITVSVELRRDAGPESVDIMITGHSRKRRAPMWTWSCREDDVRNVESVVGGVLGAVMYYRPTAPDSFLRAVAGGVVNEDPQLPFD